MTTPSTLAPPAPVALAPITPLGPGKVLIVDDDPGLLAICSEVVATLGLEVETASDGLRAIDLVRRGEYEAVVSDIGMPGADGLRLLTAVRESDLDLPVVMMTGSPELSTAIRAVEFGAMRYLVKPFSAAELQDVVAQAVRGHRLAKKKREALAKLGFSPRPEDRPLLEASFERALASLWLAYQPIVLGRDRRPFGYEALARCEEPALPHPGALFAAAEQLGRLHDLGRAVRAKAAAAAAGPPELGLFFVNLSARELSDDLLYAADTDFSRAAPRIVLEVTERASLEQVTELGARLKRLRTMGFRIAIDDLGAGYAGLTSFARLEPEVVKVDMSLVRNCHKEPVKKKLIASIGQLCREVGALAVAEGIETPEEESTVLDLGCELLQGYLIGRPQRRF